MGEDRRPIAAAKAAERLRLASMEALGAAHLQISDAGAAEVAGAKAIVPRSRAANNSRSNRPPGASPVGSAYQLKIVLRGSQPPIWRRVVVPSRIRLDWLHAVIQVAMGWTDDHLHRFVIGSREFSGDPLGGYDPDRGGGNEAEHQLGELVRKEKTKFTYEYDFGDGWRHDITLGKVIPAETAPAGAICTAWKGACPPEDSGGLWGYYSKLEVLADPRHAEHEEIKEWMGDDFDPEAFNMHAVNQRLARFEI